jgi:hypothetical protein
MVKLLQLPKILDSRGNLTFIESERHLPFAIRRIFWTYDVPGGEIRGGHAYYQQQEVIIALSGSFDVIVTASDGVKTRFSLNRSYTGLYLPPKTWRHMENFSTNALGLHLSSHPFDVADYIRDFAKFQKQ